MLTWESAKVNEQQKSNVVNYKEKQQVDKRDQVSSQVTKRMDRMDWKSYLGIVSCVKIVGSDILGHQNLCYLRALLCNWIVTKTNKAIFLLDYK